MAFSMFCLLAIRGTASPASVRAGDGIKNTGVLKRSIFLLAAYNMGIYLPLIMICICGQGPDAGPGQDSDAIVPGWRSR